MNTNQSNMTYRWIKNMIARMTLLLMVFLLGGCTHGYGTRGPIEVIIEVDEANKEDFVIGTYFYIPGRPSFFSYEYKKIVKAGEVIHFPRASLGPYITLQDSKMGERSTATIRISVEHPEYYQERTTKVSLPFSWSSEPTKVTIHLTHWDTKFAEMEAKVKLEPDKALEYRVKLANKFQHQMGSFRNRGSWMDAFTLEEQQNLRKKYLPWIMSIRKKYPETMCSPTYISDCKKWIKEGEASGFKSILPWN